LNYAIYRIMEPWPPKEEEKKCQECGSEMEERFMPTDFDSDHQYGYYYHHCRCGHEEKVKE